MKFAKRMEQFEEGIFSKLLQIKTDRLSRGETVIDLSVGTPNIPPAPHIKKALVEAAEIPENYIYAVSDSEELQEAVAYWYKKRYKVTLNPKTQVCSLLGSQEGLSHIALSIVDQGDTVLVPDPCYPVFADGPKIAGGNLYYMPQKKENNYVINLDAIPESVAMKAKFMIVSYPNNPTTVMAPDSFYENLIQFAKKYEIIVLHDNAYSELVYDGKKAGSFLAFEGANEVGVEFNSLSKTYGLAGARVGFCVGNEEVVAHLKHLKSNMDYGMFIPVQKAAIAAITGDQSCVATTRLAYQARRDVLCDGLTAIGWPIDKPEATMFVWTRIPKNYTDAFEFAMDLIAKTGVMVTPGSAFGPSGQGYVRMALVQDEPMILQAIERIRQAEIL